MINSEELDQIFFIPPEKVYKEKEIYSAIISKILKGCYGPDYPGVSLNKKNNLINLKSKHQRSAVWAINEQEFQKGLFGTLSISDATQEFGNGFGEMGKSGSLGKSKAKLGYYKYLKEWENNNPFLNDFENLIATVRNCPERKGKNNTIIKAGTGARIIMLKYLEFQQWGLAPWLLMPDESTGSYEILDLIFKFKDINQQINYIQNNYIFINSIKNKNLLNKFIKFNLKITGKFNNTKENLQQTEKLPGWKIISPTEKKNKNPFKLVPANNNIKFKDAYNKLQSQKGSMHTIYIPLTQENLEIQNKIENDGFILTGFIPGITKDKITYPIKGMWSKLKTERPIALPNYLKYPDKLSPSWYYQFVTDTIGKLKQK